MRQALDVLAMDLDQHQRLWLVLVDPCVDGLHQRALAHAASAPQERVVGGQAAGESARIVMERVGDAFDPAQKVVGDTRHQRHRPQSTAAGLPDEGVGGREIGVLDRRWESSLQRFGDAPDMVGCLAVVHPPAPNACRAADASSGEARRKPCAASSVAKRIGATIVRPQRAGHRHRGFPCSSLRPMPRRPRLPAVATSSCRCCPW